MKRLLSLALALTLSSAAAHDTISAGNVNLEWHTDANELLEVDADTTLTIRLSLPQNAPLSAERCRCTLLLYPGAVSARVRPTVLKTEVDPQGHLSTTITVNRAGDYSLVVDGRPLKMGDFAPFRTTIRLKAATDVFNVEGP